MRRVLSPEVVMTTSATTWGTVYGSLMRQASVAIAQSTSSAYIPAKATHRRADRRGKSQASLTLQ